MNSLEHRPTNPISQLSDAQECDNLKASCQPCIIHDLKKTFLIAIAKDDKIVTKVNLVVDDDAIKGGTLYLGQDAMHELDTDKKLPHGWSAGGNEKVLKEKMQWLVACFAGKDPSGKTKRLFDGFLQKHKHIDLFTDPALDAAIENHPNFISFANATLLKYIRPALKAAKWDINQVSLLTGLGPPSFNQGGWFPRTTEDYANGLKIMINGEQYVYVTVERYHYNSCEDRVEITLKYDLYDVFGLDDEDLRRFGLNIVNEAGNMFAANGFTAWWQLQHQYNYAPLLTKATVVKTVASDHASWWMAMPDLGKGRR